MPRRVRETHRLLYQHFLDKTKKNKRCQSHEQLIWFFWLVVKWGLLLTEGLCSNDDEKPQSQRFKEGKNYTYSSREEKPAALMDQAVDKQIGHLRRQIRITVQYPVSNLNTFNSTRWRSNLTINFVSNVALNVRSSPKLPCCTPPSVFLVRK
ncbi:hypothetical protein PROFUN_08873 [Planoprotostelium fungivorum]|uniref:Uncharacterized protein n=1 Tax=Planoprotostelium fungivorum TaxID=1890364 RepID=A0A2P6NJ07_9EUKA|nr:hypothetical protein PROFUN_08873 [Planoprotostelium fungivorum]